MKMMVIVIKGFPTHESTCLVCESASEIEDELHFLLKCPKYECLRSKLVDSIRSVSKCSINLNNLNLSELFTDIMSSRDKDIIWSTAIYVWDAFRLRETVLLHRSQT